MIVLNNATTADNYTDANAKIQPRGVRVDVLVANAACLLQLADPHGTFPPVNASPSSPDPTEVFLLPGGYSFEWRNGGVRVRSGSPGLPAQVTVVLLAEHDVPAPA